MSTVEWNSLELRRLSRESGLFIHVADNRGLFVSDTFSASGNILFGLEDEKSLNLHSHNSSSRLCLERTRCCSACSRALFFFLNVKLCCSTSNAPLAMCLVFYSLCLVTFKLSIYYSWDCSSLSASSLRVLLK